ncbi:hypothetical protein RsS62_01980 [Rhizobium dioscoreae]|uniref:Uncharacterized protein n=1 Tax=Rhizobium dioscoreae TaxID=2653122 RepID=A0ABQ0Z6E7_9HYPH|nr:hypothetical protein RsS62_01980 [Rhizobium dioscoreae]GES51074.1 hypothetical protein RsS93_36880 [Rhizobium dioscoreae]GLU82525.1 hypothetical protein Rhsp01_37010 [Rhizobium sp. NBRC 114257]
MLRQDHTRLYHMQVVYLGDIDLGQRLGQKVRLLLVVTFEADAISRLQDRFQESDELLRVDELAGRETLAGLETR